MGRLVHEVVPLREVAAPRPPHPSHAGHAWMRLGDALAQGVDLSYVREDIGPRERGTVYLGGYLRTVNTVHEVFVCVVPEGPDPGDPGRALPRRAVCWGVCEESADDYGHPRWHMTSWRYDRRNQPLFTIGV